MNDYVIESDIFNVDNRLICVTSIYKDGFFVADSRQDITDQVKNNLE